MILEAQWAGEIAVEAIKTNTIRVEYQTGGEYQNHVVLASKFEENAILLRESLVSAAFKFNDKLSVHKEIATSVKIEIPEQLHFKLIADETAFSLKGKLNKANILIRKGVCKIYGLICSGLIQTEFADVVILNSQIRARARNKLGEAKSSSVSDNSPKLIIESLNGDIFQQ